MDDPRHRPVERRPAPAVSVHAAGFDFGGAPLFERLTLELPAGTITGLLGPSGVGKSTLLRLVAGLAAPWPGSTVTAADGAPVSGRVAYMAQQDLLLPWLSALDNVALGARLRQGGLTATDRARAAALLDAVGLAGLEHRRPAMLSGGQRQRVALSRTLFENRPIVLMDEPFSALDAITRHDLQALATRLLAGRTVLLVTHDPAEAIRLCHRFYVMTGSPARLAGPHALPGAPPRAPDAPGLAGRHAALLAELADGRRAA
jgi:putative hydroxymethylpyrimidine transport system ATP-binding protein